MNFLGRSKKSLTDEEARAILRNSDRKDAVKEAPKWPSEEDRERIINAAKSGSPVVMLTSGKAFTIKNCKHADNCVWVQQMDAIAPCGHFIYRES